jgi:hypothetical protein
VDFSGLETLEAGILAGLVHGFCSQLSQLSTPTHTHNFGNHSDGYDHLMTAFVQSPADHRNSESMIGLSFDTILDSSEIYDF